MWWWRWTVGPVLVTRHCGLSLNDRVMANLWLFVQVCVFPNCVHDTHTHTEGRMGRAGLLILSIHRLMLWPQAAPPASPFFVSMVLHGGESQVKAETFDHHELTVACSYKRSGWKLCHDWSYNNSNNSTVMQNWFHQWVMLKECSVLHSMERQRWKVNIVSFSYRRLCWFLGIMPIYRLENNLSEISVQEVCCIDGSLKVIMSSCFINAQRSSERLLSHLLFGLNWLNPHLW